MITGGAVADSFVKDGCSGSEVQWWMITSNVTVLQLAVNMNIELKEVEDAIKNGLSGDVCLNWMNQIIELGSRT